MSIVIVRSNNLILHDPRNKGSRIRQQPDMTDGAVMALLAPWQGLIKGRPQGTMGYDEAK